LSLAAVRRITMTLALALCLLGCNSVVVNVESEAASEAPSDPLSAAPSTESLAAPSGEPIGIPGSDTLRDICPDDWLEGSLVADRMVEVALGGTFLTPTAIEVGPLDRVVWPLGVHPQTVFVRWPMDYTGVRLADGEVAVLDSAGHLVATTGRNYRLKGQWVVYGSIAGPEHPLPNGGFGGFNACSGREFVIPK
jgi:hypothetical protein